MIVIFIGCWAVVTLASIAVAALRIKPDAPATMVIGPRRGVRGSNPF